MLILNKNPRLLVVEYHRDIAYSAWLAGIAYYTEKLKKSTVFLKKLIQRCLDKAESEREGLLRMLKVYPTGSFRYYIINHNSGFLNYRISFLKHIIKRF